MSVVVFEYEDIIRGVGDETIAEEGDEGEEDSKHSASSGPKFMYPDARSAKKNRPLPPPTQQPPSSPPPPSPDN